MIIKGLNQPSHSDWKSIVFFNWGVHIMHFYSEYVGRYKHR